MTEFKQSQNVATYTFGKNALDSFADFKKEKLSSSAGTSAVVYLVDEYFKTRNDVLSELVVERIDTVFFIETADEPTTRYIDSLVAQVPKLNNELPVMVVGMGGGITLDCAKAVSNLLTNGGAAADYQGWDLVRKKGVYKVGIPTLSGTGAESSRTCVMTNLEKNIKLGMNSHFSIMDHLIMDPNLTKTVPRNQYFYTGMDTYIHCIESLTGGFRHSLADSFSREAIELCREVFNSNDMISDTGREKLMVASYLGGASIANTFVGLVHPLSAGLSTVLHFHHCIANCIVMNALEDFYKDAVLEFRNFMKRQEVTIPTGVCSKLSAQQFDLLYDSAIVHEKPLINALGPNFKDVLTRARVKEIFARM